MAGPQPEGRAGSWYSWGKREFLVFLREKEISHLLEGKGNYWFSGGRGWVLIFQREMEISGFTEGEGIF